MQNDYSKGLGVDVVPNKPEENAKAGSNFMSDKIPDWKDVEGRSFPGYPDCKTPPCATKVRRDERRLLQR